MVTECEGGKFALVTGTHVRTWHSDLRAPKNLAPRPEQRPGREPEKPPGRPELDKELEGRVIELWFSQAVPSLPQPLMGRLRRVSTYLLEIDTEAGDCWCIFKHAVAALKPVGDR